MSSTVLVRYGVIPEVARCHLSEDAACARGDDVVVQTDRGLQMGHVLQLLRPKGQNGHEDAEHGFEVVRVASDEDRRRHTELAERARGEFADWTRRIAEWNLQVTLLDLEWTVDGEKVVLYVLNDRGPDVTQLALQAAAKGLGIIEVQPVGEDGVVPLGSGGGCGSGGCGH